MSKIIFTKRYRIISLISFLWLLLVFSCKTEIEKSDITIKNRTLKQQILEDGDFHKLNNKLTVKDIEGWTLDELQVLRNSVVAKHGHCFKTEHLQKHFEKFKWYRCDPSYDKDKDLTEKDIYNIKLVATKEWLIKRHKWTERNINKINSSLSKIYDFKHTYNGAKISKSNRKPDSLIFDYVMNMKSKNGNQFLKDFPFEYSSIIVNFISKSDISDYEQCVKDNEAWYEEARKDPEIEKAPSWDQCYGPTQYTFSICIIDLQSEAYKRSLIEHLISYKQKDSIDLGDSKSIENIELKFEDNAYMLSYNLFYGIPSDYYYEKIAFIGNYALLMTDFASESRHMDQAYPKSKGEGLSFQFTDNFKAVMMKLK